MRSGCSNTSSDERVRPPMTTRLVRDDLSAFKIKRVNGNGAGGASDVDPGVQQHLKELNRLLGKAVFRERLEVQGVGAPPVRSAGRRRSGARIAAGPGGQTTAAEVVKAFLDRPLSPKYTPPK